MSNREKNSYSPNLRLLNLPAQTEAETCGMLAIAYSVELALGKVQSPAQLCNLKFNEDEIGKWLIKCLEAKKFISCPYTRQKPSRNPFTELTVNETFIKYCDSKDDHIERSPPENIGGAIVNQNPIRHACGKHIYTTAPGQHMNPTLMKGCRIQFSYDTNSQKPGILRGDWSVGNINNDGTVHILKANAPIQPLPECKPFRIIGPPCMRTLRFHELCKYNKVDSSKLLIIYPVIWGRLSDCVFTDYNTIRQHKIIELVVCYNSSDVENTLRLFEGCAIRLAVRFQDLFPVTAIFRHWYRISKNKGQLEDTFNYQQYTDNLLTKFKIKLETDGSKTSIFDGDLARYHILKNMKFNVSDPAITNTAGLMENTKFTIPINARCQTSNGTSNNTRNFMLGTKLCDVGYWASKQYPKSTRYPDDATDITIGTYVSASKCVTTCVYNHKIYQRSIGERLSPQYVNDLAELSDLVILKLKDNKKTRNDWLWHCYKIELCMNTSAETNETVCVINQIGGWETVHATAQNGGLSGSDIRMDGYVSYGGNKIVTSGKMKGSSGKFDLPIVGYQVRDPSDQRQTRTFRNDISIHKYLSERYPRSKDDWCLRILHSDHRRVDFAIAEWQQFDLRAIMRKRSPTLGILQSTYRYITK